MDIENKTFCIITLTIALILFSCASTQKQNISKVQTYDRS